MNLSLKLTASILCCGFSLSLFASDTLYCPQKHGFIKIGMTADQVIAACGEPLSIGQSKTPYTEKVPVQVLIFRNAGTPVVSHSPYSVSIRINGGALLQVTIMNNKVKSIEVNGSGANMASFCDGPAFQVGDDAGLVYAACGSPTKVNNTFIEQPIPSLGKPLVWIYQPGPNQPSITLTFVDGKLQSFNQ